MLTSDDIISEVILRCGLTSGQAGWTNQKILDSCTRHMQIDIIAEIKRANEDYLLYTETVPIVANTSTYRVPERAIANSLRHIWYEDSGGNRYPLNPRHVQEDQEFLQTNTNTTPNSFTMTSSGLTLYPGMSSTATGNLKMIYIFRPNKLVPVSEARTITAVNTNTKTLTFVSIPTTFLTSLNYDIVNNKSGNEIVHYGLTISNIDTNANTMTFNEVITDALIGQWVAIEKESPVPMFPEELQIYAMEHTIATVARGRKDSKALEIALERLAEVKMAIVEIINDRVTSKSEIITGDDDFLPGAFGGYGGRTYLYGN